jgi:hypothetical protein
MGKALTILTVLVAILLTGILPMRADLCEPATAPCVRAQSHPMDCCRGAHCHCKLSAPTQPASNPMPARAAPAPGHRMLKISVMSAGTMLLASEVARTLAWTASVNTSAPAAASPYLSTHAFLI